MVIELIYPREKKIRPSKFYTSPKQISGNAPVAFISVDENIFALSRNKLCEATQTHSVTSGHCNSFCNSFCDVVVLLLHMLATSQPAVFEI